MSAYFVLHIQYVGRPPEARNVTAALTVIGREAGDIVLNDPQGSTRHAEIHFQNGRVFVRDAGSTNGTWFNNQRMTEFPLEQGQSFRCGQTWIQLVSVQAGQPVGPMGTMVAMAAAPAAGYAQPAPQQGWGGAPQPGYGASPPAQQAPAYGAPAGQPQQQWEAQQAAWGAAQQQQAGYGGVPGAYGAPAQQAGGYAPPAQYGSPQAQPGAYGAPQQGYSAPAQQPAGVYGSPPAQQQPGAYGSPQQPQPGGYGAPPPAQLPAAQTAYSAAEQAGYGAPPPSFGARSSQRNAGAAPPPGGAPPPITSAAMPAGADPASGVRTHFDARGLDLLVKMLVGGLLSVITLGIYAPWFLCDLIRFICAHTTIGPTAHGRLKIEFTGKGGAVLVMMLVGMLLTIVTLGIYLPWFVCKQVKFFADNTLITAEDGTRYRLNFIGEGRDLLVPILVGYLLTYVTLGIYGSWFVCKLYKELATRTTILENDQPAGSLDFEGRGVDLFVTTLVGVLLSIVTLGIYIPWFQVKVYKFFAAGTRFRYQNRVFAGEFQGTGGEYALIFLVGMLLTIVTMYIYLPWFLINQWKFQWNNRVFKEIGSGMGGPTGATLGDTKFSAGMGPA